MGQLKEYRVLRSPDANPASDADLQAVLNAQPSTHSYAGPSAVTTGDNTDRSLKSIEIHGVRGGGSTQETSIGSTVWLHPSDASRLLAIGHIEEV